MSRLRKFHIADPHFGHSNIQVHRIAPNMVFERIEVHPHGRLVADYDHSRAPVTESHALSTLVGGYTTLALHTLRGSRFAVTCNGPPLCEPCLSNPAN